MSDRLPHYPNQRERDNAAAAAGLIVIFVLALVFTLGVLVGVLVKSVIG